MSMIRCSSCGHSNSEYDSQCSKCHEALPLFSEYPPKKTETTLETGTRLSHFEIIAPLGQGGMGKVYKAIDLNLNRPVAIKVLHSGFDLEGNNALLAEARLASSLNHPNIVTIHEVSEGGSPFFFVMERVDGQSLEQVIPAGGMEPERVLQLAPHIADGLARAHEAGIIHRDVKPANIMVSSEDRVTVLDFGVARTRSNPENENLDPALPQKNSSVKGTIPYMSPEQARGMPLDYKSDIFSFGTLLYQMLTGRLPFDGENKVDLIQAVCRQDPEPLESVKAGIPNSLEQLVLHCLVKEPGARPPSMLVVADRLRAIGASGQKMQPRRIVPLVLPLLILLLLVLVWRLQEPPADPIAHKLAVLPLHNTSGDPLLQTLCDGLSETVSDRLSRLQSVHGRLWVVPAGEIRHLGRMASSDLHDRFGVDLVITGSIQHHGQTRRLTLSLIDAALSRQVNSTTLDIREDRLFEAQGEVMRRVLQLLEWPSDAETLAIIDEGQTLISGAYRHYLDGLGYLYRYDQGNNLDRAVGSFRESMDLDPDYVPARVGFSDACRQQWRQTHQEIWLDRAEAALREAFRRRPGYPGIQITMGALLMERGEHACWVSRRSKPISTKWNEVF